MKNKIIILLGISYVLNITLGLFSGGGHSDASDYISLAIQIVQQNDWSQLIMISNGREIFSIWLFVLVIFMKVFGANWAVAVFVTSAFGTLSVFMFYQLMKLFFTETTSFFLSLSLAFTPVFLVISHNALYDALFLFIYLSSLFYFFRYFQTSQKKYIIYSGFIGSLLAFVHGAGYPYIFLMWLSFPLFYYQRQNLIKSWLIFSIAAGFLPIIQMIIWKLWVYDSFYPYQILSNDWLIKMRSGYTQGLWLRHYFRFPLILLLGYTPLLFGSLIYFIFDIPWARKKYLISFFGFFTALLLGLLTIINIDFIYALIIVYITIYMVLFKRSLLEENKLVFFFGFMAIFTLSIYLRFFPMPYFHQKHFVYPVLFVLPIFWYCVKRIGLSDGKIFLTLFTAYFIQFSFDIYFQLPQNRELSPPGFNVKFSNTFIFALPFTNDGDDKDIVKWYRKHDVSSQDYIITNRHERYVNAMLNMPQNHYIKLIDAYSFKNGFLKPTLEYSMNMIKKYQPKFIHWDRKLHYEEFDRMDKKGEPGVLYSYDEFVDELSAVGYIPIDSLFNKYFFFSKLSL